MLVRKAYKCKLKTNAKEKALFAKIAGCVRVVWNRSLALQKSNCEYINQQFLKLGGHALTESESKKLKKDLYKKSFPTGFDIVTKALVPVWKKSEELSFLNEYPAQSLQKPIADLDKAFYKAFTKKGGFPKFKKKGYHDSIHFPQGFKVKDRKVFLPKLGWIKFFKTRDIKGVIKNITVTSDGLGNWFASFYTEEERDIVTRLDGAIGVDLGITNTIAISNDVIVKKPKSIAKLFANKRRVSRDISRKKKGSNS